MNSENNNDSIEDNLVNELRNIRKNKGLNIEEVADKLKLSIDVIRKLESNDLKGLGAYPYVRGYLLNYTKLLDIESEKFIKLIPKSEIEVPLVNTSASYTKGIKLRRQSKNFASYALGTFIVLAVSFSGWYMLKNYTDIVKSNSTEVVENSDLEISPKQELSFANNEIDGTPNEQTETYHYSSLIPTDESHQIDEDTSLDIPQQNLPVEDVLVDESPVIDSVYNVTIETTETSWVKVEQLDKSQKYHNDLLQPGIITIQSNDPIHFRIGNEKNVKVTINGESIDLSRFSSKNIADFNWPIES